MITLPSFLLILATFTIGSARSTTDDLPYVNTEPGLEYSDEARDWQGIPGIERTPNGRLWVTWYSGGTREPEPENYVLLVTSDDDGATWSSPRVVIDPEDPIRAYDPVLWHDPLGRLWFIWSQREGRVNEVWAILTDDSERVSPTWSEPRKLMPGVMMNKPTVLSSGEWLFPATPWGDETRVYVTVDEGRTFRHLGSANTPGVHINEQMIVEKEDRSLWMLVRTREPEPGITESFSTDGGKTWTDARRYLDGPRTRFFIRRLPSGRLLMIYHHNTVTRNNLSAYLSEEEGKTWTYRLLLDERESVSYPDVAVADDGTLYAVYDRDRRGAGEILMAVFTEEDVMAGDFISPSSRSKEVINRLPAVRMPERVKAGLRKALAAMTTRQWSGGWPDASTLDGTIVKGQARIPIPHYYLTIEPPATPSTARTFLRAARVLGDDTYLHHARMAKRAMLAVQSKEGGFPKEAAPAEGPASTGTFDDNVTTGALDFLIDLWQYTGDEAALKAVLSVGEFLLISQYPESGGWPQVYPPRPDHFQRHITFNDRAMSNVINGLLRLYEHLGDPRYLEAAVRGGDCIIRLQGPPGQDIWGQQHDPETLLPAPARSFEPAAYTTWESGAVMNSLIELYLVTSEERFLEPLPKAFAWFEANRLPGGNWARYYEPGTGRPIYGDRDGSVHYRLEDISLERQHGYGWEGNFYPHSVKAAYDRIQEIGREAYREERRLDPPVNRQILTRQMLETLQNQHPDGWWVEIVTGVGYFESGAVRNAMMEAGEPEESHEKIRAGTFARNADLLMDYIEAGL